MIIALLKYQIPLYVTRLDTLLLQVTHYWRKPWDALCLVSVSGLLARLKPSRHVPTHLASFSKPSISTGSPGQTHHAITAASTPINTGTFTQPNSNKNKTPAVGPGFCGTFTRPKTTPASASSVTSARASPILRTDTLKVYILHNLYTVHYELFKMYVLVFILRSLLPNLLQIRKISLDSPLW